MPRLVWTLPDGQQTARWAEDEGGGSQNLAEVLAVGGDPDGNPVTGDLAITGDVTITASADRTEAALAIFDLITEFAPPYTIEIQDANGNPLIRMYSEKYFSGTNRAGTVGLSAYTTAGAQIGSALMDGRGYIDMGHDATLPYPVYVYEYVTGDTLFLLTKAGVPIFGGAAVPASSDLGASTFALWLDPTPGSAKLMIKAKNSSGTVVTGSVALS